MFGCTMHIDISCCALHSADGRSVLPMKKIYNAPVLECLAFCSAAAIGAEIEDPEQINSALWNDGELNWT